ncbi:hypothetical protein BJV78DRAFT_1183480 [Lactifluus subvellereus]|nr:hypothetical protein BJV78DRAFT_1183480 [Lactifluus subvellereus]
MTPTRTDTTPMQERRAFKSISLNNTRPHLRPRVPGACSTATASLNDEHGSDSLCGDYTREQLIHWVMSKDAVASCFVKDVLSMPESENGGLPYYFLGRVPCRSVSLVAIVVGAVAYERRVLYTLDDGTGTIECAFRVDQDKPEGKTSKNQAIAPLVQEPKRRLATKETPTPPVIPVGSVVKVQGRIHVKHNSREIQGASIERCRGPRDELDHWRQVSSLHKSYYFLPERFVIPTSSGTTTAIDVQDVPRTPKSANVVNSIPLTPSTHSTVSSSAASSPVKSSEGPSLLPRLRHPSRLRSRDLTENTFRIYVKHFMDNLHYLNSSPHSCESDLDSDTDSIAAAIDQTPGTPTKRKLTPCNERTPRVSRRTSGLSTPRPRSHPASCAEHSGHRDEKQAVIGCTLSFLLRVPELATLARRVVQAEARQREKRKESQSEVVVNSTAERRKALVPSTEGPIPKVKRLFSWAIRKLYQDGSIILWDGPSLSVLEPPHRALDSSKLYRSSRPDDNNRSTSSHRISGCGAQPADHTEDLSDPPSDEEAYASLSTAYLATQVEQAIRSFTALQTKRKGEIQETFLGPAVSRRRLLPLPGPTKDDITNHLKRRDDRWKRVNAWAVQEALEWLRDNDRVWCVSEDGGGRWELCS